MSQWACDPRSIRGRTLYPRLKGASGHVRLGVCVAALQIPRLKGVSRNF